jgi:hypothetical protein
MPASSGFYIPVSLDDVEMSVTYNTMASSSSYYVVVREVDANNVIYADISYDGTNITVTLYQISGGTPSTLYTSSATSTASAGNTTTITATGSTVSIAMGTINSGAQATTVTAPGNCRLSVAGGTVTINSAQVVAL